MRPVALVGTFIEADAVGSRGGTDSPRFVVGVELEATDEIRRLVIESIKRICGRAVDGS